MRKRKKRYQPKQKKQPTPPPERPASDYTAAELLESTGNWPERILIAIGQDLHAGRKVEPKESDDYDEAIGVSYTPFDVEIEGFRIRANPRRIGVREVAAYADQSCRRCHGRGFWVMTRRAEAGRDETGCKVMQDLAYEQSCGCADRRYKERFRQVLIDSQLGEWIALDQLSIAPVGEAVTEQDLQDVYEDVKSWPSRRGAT